MAFKHVKYDINSFGGDILRVKLVGQSSGAELIKTLFVTLSATSLFARAILQSAPLDFSDQSIAIGDQIGALAASNLNCTKSTCLRSASDESLLDSQASIIAQGQSGQLEELAAMGSFIQPVVDGKLVTRDFKTAVAKGEALEGSFKKLLFTTMKDEGAFAISGLMPSALPTYVFDPVVSQFYGDRAAAIIDSDLYYPSHFLETTRRAMLSSRLAQTTAGPDVTSSRLSTSPDHTRRSSSLSSTAVSPSSTTPTPSPPNERLTNDIYTLFNPNNAALTRAQRVLVKEVQARWAGFARTGSPNAAGYRTWWPVQSGSNLNILLLGYDSKGNSGVIDTQRTAECAIGKGVYSLA